MATYEFKGGQDEVPDASKVILKTTAVPEHDVVKEVTLPKLEGYLADMIIDRDARSVSIVELEEEIDKIKKDLNI